MSRILRLAVIGIVLAGLLVAALFATGVARVDVERQGSGTYTNFYVNDQYEFAIMDEWENGNGNYRLNLHRFGILGYFSTITHYNAAPGSNLREKFLVVAFVKDCDPSFGCAYRAHKFFETSALEPLMP